MDFALDEEQQLLRSKIVDFARAELNDGVIERDDRSVFPAELWQKCGSLGLHGLPVPTRYGGAGIDPLTTAVAFEALGYGCTDGGLVFAICAHLFACIVPIWKHGSEEQKARYLPSLCDGTRIAVNAMTEAGSGSSVDLATRATSDGDGYLIQGTKTFASNGPIADLALVYARTDAGKTPPIGVSAFLVDKGTAGFAVGQIFDKMGLRTAPLSELVFDDCRVPGSALLGREGNGFPIFNQSMNWERTCIAAVHVGTVQRLLETAIEHARTRLVSGKPIGTLQAISHRIADMKVRLEASRGLVYRTAWNLDRSRSAAMDAAITKLFVSEALVASALDTLQVLGGTGYMKDGHVERTLRDAAASTIYSGTSEIQRNLIASWLGL